VLALVLSVLLTVYLVVPEAIFKFIFGFYIPTRTFVLTGTETAYRAVLVAFLPFWFSLALCWYVPGPRHWPFPVEHNSVQQRRTDYKTVASGLYSEAEYAKSKTEFWPAFTRCSRRQVRLILWYFLLVALEAWITGFVASSYARLKNVQTDSSLSVAKTLLNRISRWLTDLRKWLNDRFLSPYISHWHPLLTPNLLSDTEIQADVLCTNEVLYQGTISQYFMKDGDLSGIILQKPRRFNRALFLKAKEEGQKPDKKNYWVPIPSQHLYFFAEKIINMNLSYVTVSDKIRDPANIEKFLADSPLAEGLGKLRVYVAMPVECPHCKTKQTVHVAAKPGFAQMGDQTITCVQCRKDFPVLVPDKIVGGPFADS